MYKAQSQAKTGVSLSLKIGVVICSVTCPINGSAREALVDAAQVISNGLRSDDFLGSLPLVRALGPGGRLWSVRWVDACLHRMIDLADLRLRVGWIHDKIAAASTAVAAPS